MAAEGRSPFLDADGERRLIDCALLYFDMLGVGTMAEGAEADRELRRFEQAITRSFRFELGTMGSGDDAIVAAAFSDSFVLVAPVQEDFPAPRAEAIANLIFEAASMQGVLAVNDFFVRGAITLGKCHMHSGLIFGPALVEAVRLEEKIAREPRIILSPAAIEALRAGRRASVAREPLLVDSDGLAFVDYLELLYTDPVVTARQNLGAHRRKLRRRLDRHEADVPRWLKYRWIAEYHDDFLRRHEPEMLVNELDVSTLRTDIVHKDRRMRLVHPAQQDAEL